MASVDEKARTTGDRALSQSEVQSCRRADASPTPSSRFLRAGRLDLEAENVEEILLLRA